MQMIVKKRVFSFVTFVSVFVASIVFAAGPSAKIEQLSWMTGNWAGALGPNQLEENWIAVEGRSLAAMVRMTGDDATSMFEMITIEEEAGSLVLHIQQWDPGFKPRTSGAQRMELGEITASSVLFNATDEGGMKSLGYSHPENEVFIIHVEQASGAKIDINLSARSIW
jgi:hypothetical protein